MKKNQKISRSQITSTEYFDITPIYLKINVLVHKSITIWLAVGEIDRTHIGRSLHGTWGIASLL